MKVGLFFGTFNPVHVGHVILANHMVQYTDLDAVWFVVTPHNPFKKKASLLHDYDRLEMVDKALKGYDHLDICDAEFRLEQPNYTSNTLVHLTESYPSYEFGLIMGGDNLLGLHKWKNVDYITSNFPVYVYPRPGFEVKIPESLKGDFRIVDNAPFMQISATFIRKSIKDRKDVRPMLQPEVWEYIDSMGFYR